MSKYKGGVQSEFVMQINRRDYIEFQLEESSSSGITGGGGGVGGGVADDKLDYRVTMAIEKNTQLVSFTPPSSSN